MYQELDCPFNSLSEKIHENLSTEVGKPLLEEVTHIIDCECYYIDGVRVFREVSICDLRTLKIENIHCFAENFCSYHEMSEKN